MPWSTPDDLAAEARRLWDRGRLLVSGDDANVAGFPLRLPLRRPTRAEMSERFDEVRSWIRRLEEGSKARRGFGYEIEWGDIEHRQLGRNRVPLRALLRTCDDAVRLAGKHRQAERFKALAAATRERCPELGDWMIRKPLVLLEHADDWNKILTVLMWFRAHPRPGIYLRQLDIAGVDTKFIENRRPILAELLALVLPADAVDRSKRHFEARHGLLSKPPLVRVRLLDPRHEVAGFSDLTVPVSEFARWQPSVRQVFVTENETNGLCFPSLPDSAVIFGLGYALELLSAADWLRERTISYWGDIDTHGFDMLDRLRASFPAARSLLMDEETLLAHRDFWVQEDVQHRERLLRLTPAEQALYDSLLTNRWAERVRLEQERVRFDWLKTALAAAFAPDHPSSRA